MVVLSWMVLYHITKNLSTRNLANRGAISGYKFYFRRTLQSAREILQTEVCAGVGVGILPCQQLKVALFLPPMVALTKWFERKFNFDFPLGVFPTILERLRGTPIRLEEMTKTMPKNILTVQLDGRWSILENIGHLGDIEELHDGRLDDYKAGLSTLRPADLQNLKTKEANHNSTELETLLVRFRKSRKRFLEKLETFSNEDLARVSLHPRLKQPMRVVDMCYFMAEHDDNHLARISEIAHALQVKK
ncbi:MAG: DinB family protein [Limisphaerales bacterium]